MPPCILVKKSRSTLSDTLKKSKASKESFDVRCFYGNILPEFLTDQHRNIAMDALARRKAVVR